MNKLSVFMLSVFLVIKTAPPLLGGAPPLFYEFSPDGRYYIRSFEGDVAVWELVSRDVLFTKSAAERYSLRVALTDRYVAADVYRIGVMVWDLIDGTMMVKIPIDNPNNFIDIRLSPDNRFLAIMTKEEIFLHSLPSGELYKTLRDPAIRNRGTQYDLFRLMTFSPDSRYLAVSSSEIVRPGQNKRQGITLWDVESGHIVNNLSDGEIDSHLYAYSPAFSPDGSLLIYNSPDYDYLYKGGTLRVWDIKKQELCRIIPEVRSAGFLTSGELLVSTIDSHAVLYKLEGGAEEIRYFDDRHVFDGRVLPSRLSPSGNIAIHRLDRSAGIGGLDGMSMMMRGGEDWSELELWDPVSGEFLRLPQQR